MKYVGITAALAIACLLMMPAFSMPDQNDGKKMDSKFDVEQAMCWQHQICPQCQEPKGPMGDDGKQQVCPCKGTDGEQKFGPESMKDDKGFCHKSIKSMMDGKCQGPMGQMGDDGKQQMCQCKGMDGEQKFGPESMKDDKGSCQESIKSMMDGKCQGPKMGDDGKQQMTQCQNKEWGQKEQMGDDGKQQMTQCQNKDWGQKFGPKSMMDGKEMEGKSLCHKPIKSMMGDEKRGDDKGETEEIAILMLIRR
jgi:hypothetical protein